MAIFLYLFTSKKKKKNKKIRKTPQKMATNEKVLELLRKSLAIFILKNGQLAIFLARDPKNSSANSHFFGKFCEFLKNWPFFWPQKKKWPQKWPPIFS